MTKRELAIVAVALVGLAALLHFTHYLIFHDAHHVFIYMFGDIAFLPVEILVISLVVDRVLSEREREALRQKMNMVIGTFFSVLGRPLMARLPEMLENREEVMGPLAIAPKWTKQDISRAREQTRDVRLKIRPGAEDLEYLREVLIGNREFLLRLLANPVLLEHDDFAELLWAISHLEDELSARGDLAALPQSDLNHLAGDVHRLYSHLLREWLEYMAHLNERYPFLFSFASRTNPLRPDANVTVTE